MMEDPVIVLASVKVTEAGSQTGGAVNKAVGPATGNTSTVSET
jgi:hypothetical protein